MPKLSSFFGIEISIRTRETPHHRPHFHARYAGKEVSIAIDTSEWAILHRAELFAAWTTILAGRSPEKISPLA